MNWGWSWNGEAKSSEGIVSVGSCPQEDVKLAMLGVSSGSPTDAKVPTAHSSIKLSVASKASASISSAITSPVLSVSY